MSLQYDCLWSSPWPFTHNLPFRDVCDEIVMSEHVSDELRIFVFTIAVITFLSSPVSREMASLSSYYYMRFIHTYLCAISIRGTRQVEDIASSK